MKTEIRFAIKKHPTGRRVWMRGETKVIEYEMTLDEYLDMKSAEERHYRHLYSQMYD